VTPETLANIQTAIYDGFAIDNDSVRELLDEFNRRGEEIREFRNKLDLVRHTLTSLST
jgi:hypothetical protein